MDPLCYGQLSFWRWLERTPQREWVRANITRVLPLGAGVPLAAARDVLAEACARHESLRTVYDGRRPDFPCQIVHRAVDPPIEVVDLPDAEDQGVQRIAASLSRRGFTLDEDFGWRAVVAAVGGRAAALVLTMNHIVADGWALNRLADELTAWCAAGGPPAGDGGPEPAPRALAAEQRSDAWAERRAAAHAYWTDLLRSAPPPPPEPTGDGVPLSGSASLGRASGAVSAIARRERVFPQAVVLTLMAITIARATDSRRFLLWLMASNRFEPRWRTIVTTMNQGIPIIVDLRPDEPFAELLKRLQGSSLTAFRNGCYDADDVRRVALDVTGRPAAIGYAVNYAGRGWPPELAPGELASVRAPRPSVNASSRPAVAPFYGVVEGDRELSVAVHAHASFDPGSAIQTFYRSLVVAATVDDVATGVLLAGGHEPGDEARDASG